MLAYGVAPDVALITLPVWVAAAVLVALGVGLWLAALNALYRDVRYAVGFGLQVWLFASPVVFPSSLVEGAERWLFALNPMVGGDRRDALGARGRAGSTGRGRRVARLRPCDPRQRSHLLPARRAPDGRPDLMARSAIEVEGLGKRYRLGEDFSRDT